MVKMRREVNKIYFQGMLTVDFSLGNGVRFDQMWARTPEMEWIGGSWLSAVNFFLFLWPVVKLIFLSFVFVHFQLTIVKGPTD